VLFSRPGRVGLNLSFDHPILSLASTAPKKEKFWYLGKFSPSKFFFWVDLSLQTLFHTSSICFLHFELDHKMYNRWELWSVNGKNSGIWKKVHISNTNDYGLWTMQWHLLESWHWFFIWKYIKIDFYLASLRMCLFSWLVIGFSKLKNLLNLLNCSKKSIRRFSKKKNNIYLNESFQI